jgi:hypothetical protein
MTEVHKELESNLEELPFALSIFTLVSRLIHLRKSDSVRCGEIMRMV